MEPDIVAMYFSEIVIGAMLTVFGAFLRYWFQGVTKQIDKILEKIDLLVGDFHEHKVEDAKNFGRINADIHHMYKRMEGIKPKDLN